MHRNPFSSYKEEFCGGGWKIDGINKIAIARSRSADLYFDCKRQDSGASQVVLVVKNPPAKAGDTGDVGSAPGLGRSLGVGHGNPLKYSCLENPHGQRSLEGYSPWGCKESDSTEQLSTVRWI